MKNIIFTIITVTFLQSCGQNKINIKSIQTKDYLVTKTFSKSIGKPEVHFNIKVPTSLKLTPAVPGKKNRSYVKVDKHDKNGILQQMLTLGHLNTFEKGAELEKASISFLYQLKDLLTSAGYVFEESELLVKKFDGKEYPLFQGIGELKNNSNPEYQGRYYINIVIVPNPYGDTNIMFYMIAKDNQNINRYQDFTDRLDISKIWESFKYIK